MSADAKIEPALTAEEWKQWRNGGILGLAIKTRVGVAGNERLYVDAIPISAPHDYHSLAAPLLDGQRFGFTREDVALLKEVSEAANSVFPLELDESESARLTSIAARIEALLPPEP